MIHSPDAKPNCVGFAYSQIGFKPDGFYDPDGVLNDFERVPMTDAELAATLYRGLRIDHVVPFNPENPGKVIHRPQCGATPEPATFDDAIGRYSGYSDYQVIF